MWSRAAADCGKHCAIGRRSILEQRNAVADDKRGVDEFLLESDMAIQDAGFAGSGFEALEDERALLPRQGSVAVCEADHFGVALRRETCGSDAQLLQSATQNKKTSSVGRKYARRIERKLKRPGDKGFAGPWPMSLVDMIRVACPVIY